MIVIKVLGKRIGKAKSWNEMVGGFGGLEYISVTLNEVGMALFKTTEPYLNSMQLDMVAGTINYRTVDWTPLAALLSKKDTSNGH